MNRVIIASDCATCLISYPDLYKILILYKSSLCFMHNPQITYIAYHHWNLFRSISKSTVNLAELFGSIHTVPFSQQAQSIQMLLCASPGVGKTYFYSECPNIGDTPLQACSHGYTSIHISMLLTALLDQLAFASSFRRSRSDSIKTSYFLFNLNFLGLTFSPSSSSPKI